MKKAFLHWKNALFYCTLNGARIGDLFKSLTHTAELRNVMRRLYQPHFPIAGIPRSSSSGCIESMGHPYDRPVNLVRVLSLRKNGDKYSSSKVLLRPASDDEEVCLALRFETEIMVVSIGLPFWPIP